MENLGIIGLILLIVNFLYTYQGLKKVSFFDENLFRVQDILNYKEYKRLISAGFLHVDWWHFGFNMLTLYFFSGALETKMGLIPFIVVYFASLIGGNLISLYIHRNHSDYSAVGASGAVSGVVFACIALFPSLKIGLILLPFSMPAWLFGGLYIAYSIYGIKTQKDNIGHEAHLGGAFIGMLIAISFFPKIVLTNYLPIGIILILIIVFLIILIRNPNFLIFSKDNYRKQDIDEKYYEERKTKQQEIDFILDKINEKGIDSLSQQEKDKLNDLSK